MSTPILKLYEGKYYAFWSTGRRSRRKSMGTENRAVAEDRFAQWLLLGGHRADVGEETRAALTVADLWKVYDKLHLEETAAPASARYAWKNLEPHFGALTPASIDQAVVDDYEEQREEGRIGRPGKSSTIRKELVLLRAALNWNASPGRGKRALLDKADVPLFELPAEGPAKDRWLTTAEISAVLKAARDMRPGENRMSRGERFLWLALETAARKGAIMDLTWDRVDFETRVIHFHNPARPATKKRRPSVPISDALLPVLRRMYEERTGELVMDHDGEVWATVQFIVIRAGLAPRQKRSTGQKVKSTGISPHTFRHTAATQMARRGVPLYDIAGILGNTLAMVEQVYAKHCPGRLRAAVNSITSGVLEPAE